MDAQAVVDALKINRFYNVGRSAGGPHALATAAKLGHRVIRTLVAAGTGPTNMSTIASNERVYSGDKSNVIHDITQRYEAVIADPRIILNNLIAAGEIAPSDLRTITDPAIRWQLLSSYRHAVKNGPEGWIDDVLAIRGPWINELEPVTTPVDFWVGKEDKISTLEHAHAIADMMPNALTEIHLAPMLGHFAAMHQLRPYIHYHNSPSELDDLGEPRSPYKIY
jgi:pimeloyl-ACP methyl ester carboxylesterase